MRPFRHPLLAFLTLLLAVLPGVLPHVHGHARDGGNRPAAEEIRPHACGDRERHGAPEDLRDCPICRYADARAVVPAGSFPAVAPAPASLLPLPPGFADPRPPQGRTAAGRSPPAYS